MSIEQKLRNLDWSTLEVYYSLKGGQLLLGLINNSKTINKLKKLNEDIKLLEGKNLIKKEYARNTYKVM